MEKGAGAYGRGQISVSLARLGNRYVVDMSMLFFLGFCFGQLRKTVGKRGGKDDKNKNNKNNNNKKFF